jgi:hypothetical protein
MTRLSRVTRRSLSRPTRVAAVLVAALAATAALSGCGEQEKLGAAAVVDGHTISTDQLQSDTNEFLKIVPGQDPAHAQLQILQRIIVSRLIDKEAAKLGVHASPGEVAKARANLPSTVKGTNDLVRQLAGGQAPVFVPPSLVDRWIKDQVLYAKIAKKLAVNGDATSQQSVNATNRALTATGRAMKVEVSPRYGTWSPKLGLSPLVSGGLSKTAAEMAKG